MFGEGVEADKLDMEAVSAVASADSLFSTSKAVSLILSNITETLNSLQLDALKSYQELNMVTDKVHQLRDRLLVLVDEHKMLNRSSGNESESVGKQQTDEFSDALDCALGVLCESVMDLRAKVENDRRDAVVKKRDLELKIEKTFSLFEEADFDLRTDGSYTWRIGNFTHLLHSHRTSNQNAICCPRFQTPEGYEFRMKMFANGASSGKGLGTHVSVFIQLCRTDYDDVLLYPFQGKCVITLYDQNIKPNRKKEHFKLMFNTNKSNCFSRPISQYNPENGIPQFVSHQFLTNHTARDNLECDKPIYVYKDVMFIGCKIQYNAVSNSKTDLAASISNPVKNLIGGGGNSTGGKTSTESS